MYLFPLTISRFLVSRSCGTTWLGPVLSSRGASFHRSNCRCPCMYTPYPCPPTRTTSVVYCKSASLGARGARNSVSLNGHPRSAPSAATPRHQNVNHQCDLYPNQDRLFVGSFVQGILLWPTKVACVAGLFTHPFVDSTGVCPTGEDAAANFVVFDKPV